MIGKEQRIAHHEAAHAVLARAFGVGVTSVAIWPDGDKFFGATIFDSTAGRHWLDIPEPWAVMMYSGVIADSVLTGKRRRIRGTDADNLDMMLPACAPVTRRTLRARSRRCVIEHWDMIAAVAAELVREHKIDGARLDRMLAETHSPAPTPSCQLIGTNRRV